MWRYQPSVPFEPLVLKRRRRAATGWSAADRAAATTIQPERKTPPQGWRRPGCRLWSGPLPSWCSGAGSSSRLFPGFRNRLLLRLDLKANPPLWRLRFRRRWRGIENVHEPLEHFHNGALMSVEPCGQFPFPNRSQYATGSTLILKSQNATSSLPRPLVQGRHLRP